MTNNKFDELFGAPARKSESKLSQREMDLARSIQEVVEIVVLKMARHIHKVTGMKNLCLSGGVALNCVANGKILREGPFDDIWIQPASGDAGSALGAALITHYHVNNAPRKELILQRCKRLPTWVPNTTRNTLKIILRQIIFLMRKFQNLK